MAEIDIAVSPDMRGKGVGTKLLKEGCQTYLIASDVDYVIAEVKKENMASIRIFENAGFMMHEEDEEMVRMVFHR